MLLLELDTQRIERKGQMSEWQALHRILKLKDILECHSSPYYFEDGIIEAEVGSTLSGITGLVSEDKNKFWSLDSRHRLFLNLELLSPMISK